MNSLRKTNMYFILHLLPLSSVSEILCWWIWGSSLSQNIYWFPYSRFPYSFAKCFNRMF